MTISPESNFSSNILQYLKSFNHTVAFDGWGCGVSAISKLNHPGVTANSDYRRLGSVAGF